MVVQNVNQIKTRRLLNSKDKTRVSDNELGAKKQRWPPQEISHNNHHTKTLLLTKQHQPPSKKLLSANRFDTNSATPHPNHTKTAPRTLSQTETPPRPHIIAATTTNTQQHHRHHKNYPAKQPYQETNCHTNMNLEDDETEQQNTGSDAGLK